MREKIEEKPGSKRFPSEKHQDLYFLDFYNMSAQSAPLVTSKDTKADICVPKEKMTLIGYFSSGFEGLYEEGWGDHLLHCEQGELWGGVSGSWLMEGGFVFQLVKLLSLTFLSTDWSSLPIGQAWNMRWMSWTTQR